MKTFDASSRIAVIFENCIIRFDFLRIRAQCKNNKLLLCHCDIYCNIKNALSRTFVHKIFDRYARIMFPSRQVSLSRPFIIHYNIRH